MSKTKGLCPLCNGEVKLVGRKELAEMIGWDPRFISTYRKRGHIPPDFELSSGPVWFLNNPQVQEFIKKHKK